MNRTAPRRCLLPGASKRCAGRARGLRFLEQSLQLHRCTDAGRHRAEQAHVGVAEYVLARHVLYGDDADHVGTDDDRHAEIRFGKRLAELSPAQFKRALQRILVHEQRLARLHDVRGEAAPERDRLDADAPSELHEVAKVIEIGGAVVQNDLQRFDIEHGKDFVADQINHRLQIEFCADGLAQARDHFQAGRVQARFFLQRDILLAQRVQFGSELMEGLCFVRHGQSFGPPSP